MRLLFVVCEPPDSPMAGSIIQTYHFMRLLRSRHEVGVWCVTRPGTEARQEVLKKQFPSCYFMPITDRPWRHRLAWMFGGDPMARWGYETSEMTRSVSKAIADFRPDVVQFEQLHVAGPILSLSRGDNRPLLILNEHDALYVILARVYFGAAVNGKAGDKTLTDDRGAPRIPHLLWPPAAAMNARWVRGLRDLERRVARSADAVLCVSEVDAKMLSLPEVAKRYFVTPNGVDTEWFTALPPKPSHLAPTVTYLGNLSYGPNYQAIKWYAEEIHPLLRAKRPDLRMVVIGEPTSALDPYRGIAGIEFVGFQRDPRPFVENSDISLAPLRSGSGTRFKILDSWAMGRPVVSTTIGAEGLPYRDGENLLIGDDAQSIAQKTLELLDDQPLCRRLAKAGRLLVEREFSWNRIVADLERIYEALPTPAAGPNSPG